MAFPRKKIRLPAANYIGLRRYFLTFCCLERRRCFVQTDFNQYFVEKLREQSAVHQIAAAAYCLMPDHVHLLMEALAVNSNLAPFVKALKQVTGFEFERRTGQRLWQRYYYDHVLRPKDEPDGVAWYIWLNPVRAGLCEEPRDFQFLGSLTGLWPPGTRPDSIWAPPKKESGAT
ncbi:MAG TPA: transposase [Methylomirabilota bacterium]|nr:transposase [Methylomirabilota bacterium]